MQKLTIKGREIGVVKAPLFSDPAYMMGKSYQQAMAFITQEALALMAKENVNPDFCQILLSLTTLEIVASVWTTED